METLPNQPYLRVEVVAAFYGFDPNTVYTWIREGKVPADRIGPNRALRIRREIAMTLAQPFESPAD